MKTLKKARQKNVVLDRWHYHDPELKAMLQNHEIWYVKEDDERNEPMDIIGYDVDYRFDTREFRIGCTNAELKVVCDDGYYTNVLVKDGKTYFVTLS